MADEIAPFGDSALLVTLGRAADRSLTVRARAIAEALGAPGASAAGLGRPIPAHASVLVPFDPLVLDREAAVGFVRRAMETAPDGAGAEPDLARTASAPSAAVTKREQFSKKGLSVISRILVDRSLGCGTTFTKAEPDDPSR